MSAMSLPAPSRASSHGSPGPGMAGRMTGSPWNRACSAGSVISAVLNPVSSSSQPPSHCTSTPGTGTRSSRSEPSCTRIRSGRSIRPSVTGTTRRTPDMAVSIRPSGGKSDRGGVLLRTVERRGDAMTSSIAPIQDRLAEADVAGITIVWADNNGIPRSRTVPIAGLADAAERGVGMSPLFAVFDSRDGISFAHSGLSNASGDIRLMPVIEQITPLAGQPGFAWAPGRQLGPDGEPSPYDQRSRLEAQVARAAAAGLSVRAGFELEFFVSRAGDELAAAHQGAASR